MWQMYSIGSLVAGAFESAIDKAGIVGDARVDSYAASFYRTFFFFLATLTVGLTGILGNLQLFIHWSIVPLAFLGLVSTLLFTYLLRKVEITVISAASYLTPILFLIIDTSFLGINLSQAEVLGIILLVCGGIAFSLDGKTEHFKREFTWKVAGAFVFIYILQSGIENYTFKHFSDGGLNAISYYASIWSLTTLLFLGVLLVKGKMHTLVARAAVTYIPYAALGKTFDAFNSILFLSAVSIATVSQVSAFNALFPLVVFIAAVITQSFFGIGLK
ncbi:MAG: EamA family transporter, partial [Minisyncoccia bacterium]